jgi:tartrate dehydrogenase/decarboxylase/D-malate dehydrogenase
VATEFPDVAWDRMLVESRHDRRDQPADILSDLAAVLAGSLAVAPTANIDPERRLC